MIGLVLTGTRGLDLQKPLLSVNPARAPSSYENARALCPVGLSVLSPSVSPEEAAPARRSSRPRAAPKIKFGAAETPDQQPKAKTRLRLRVSAPKQKPTPASNGRVGGRRAGRGSAATEDGEAAEDTEDGGQDAEAIDDGGEDDGEDEEDEDEASTHAARTGHVHSTRSVSS